MSYLGMTLFFLREIMEPLKIEPEPLDPRPGAHWRRTLSCDIDSQCMSISFAKAPLVELVAELRWIPGTAAEQPTVQPVLLLGDTKVEEFFMRLGGELYQSGFQRSERLVPPGFPTIPGQVVFRYRSDKSPQKSVLYQVGPGVFSVNGIPPYQSWEVFSPSVRSGVEALLKSRGPEQEKQPFTQVSLRYIDFFGDELMGGRTFVSFISDVLGISTKLPDALTAVAKPNEVRSSVLKVVLPLEIGTLTMSVGDGRVNNQSGIVLDTTIASTAEIPSDTGAIMEMLDAAHEVMHKIFLDLTRPIHKLMQPQ